MTVSNLFRQSLDAAKRMKILLLFVLFLYIVSFLSGLLLISTGDEFADEIKERIQQSVLTQQPFTSILESLRTGNLAAAVITTFGVNLCIGAFLATTLPGILPVLGALGIITVTALRGFFIGVTYPELLVYSPLTFIVGFGTMILELGAYVFSAAAGINISLAPVFPKRYQTESRWLAFKRAWKDAARIFLIVALLLALGAVWEMTGIYVLIHII